MRKSIILICVLLAILIPACILTSPQKISPLPTSVPPETQAAPTAANPTEVTATEASPTATPLASATATNTAPPPQIPATAGPTATPLPVFKFYMQAGTPVRLANFVIPESGCNWLGIAGQVFDQNGNPISGVVIEVGGSLNGQPVQQLALTGSNTILGPGGFVVVIADHPAQSDGTLWFQLLDQAGDPKTGRTFFTTSSSCEENLTIVNLVEANPIVSRIRLPVVMNGAP